jgi:prepilin-type N-terminal cleavage/methylation domain-containing protein
MTCPPRIRKFSSFRRSALDVRCSTFPKGFTLLEIVIVLAISGLIIGGAIATVVLASSQRKLTVASGDIELLAKRARTAAILHQTPYAIEFHQGFIQLLPLSEASEFERTTALGNEIGGTISDSENAKPQLRDKVEIDPDLTLTIRRWNTEDFVTPSDNLIPIWRFDPEGLSEPLTVRLTVGDSYAQDTYHPLTAAIADSELEAN